MDGIKVQMNFANVTLVNDDDENVILWFEVRFQVCLKESIDSIKFGFQMK